MIVLPGAERKVTERTALDLEGGFQILQASSFALPYLECPPLKTTPAYSRMLP